MKLILVLPAAGLLFSGAMSLDKMSPSPLVLPEKIAIETAPRMMWTNNSALYKGETLRLHFRLPHPQYLGVIDPDGHFFYVVFPKENSAGKLKPFVSSERFEAMKTLKINTSKFKADPYTYGVLENKPVFTKSGRYRFLLGDNLHVDDASAVTILKVKYTHSARPLPDTDIAAIID
jgi:hypothetical protein